MKPETKRSLLRWVHIIFGLMLVAYIYGPPSETVKYLSWFRFIYMPVVLLSGLWMWKGGAFRRLFPKSSSDQVQVNARDQQQEGKSLK